MLICNADDDYAYMQIYDDYDYDNDFDAAQVGERFPLLQRPLHSFPRQQCHRPQGSHRHHHPRCQH